MPYLFMVVVVSWEALQNENGRGEAIAPKEKDRANVR